MILTKSDFSYQLPDELVAHRPLRDRSSSKMLVYRQREIIDTYTNNLKHYLPKGAMLVRNNSRVIPSRIFGQTVHGGKVEIMLLQPILDSTACRWQALGRPLKKLKEHSVLKFGDVEGRILKKHENHETPYVDIEFTLTWEQFYTWIQDVGHIPLPPYIKRETQIAAKDSPDRETYQTVYANTQGSVAAPTAGLHFNSQLIQQLQEQGVTFCDVTLHVGAGTFLPVKTESLNQHVMHKESYFVSSESYESIIKAKSDGRPIIGVGTTSLRCLESFYLLGKADEDWSLHTNKWHQTDLFIKPTHKDYRYKPAWMHGLMTNFHQPESTLLMLVSSLVGFEEVRSIYQHAIQKNYRFFSYGDASLLYF